MRVAVLGASGVLGSAVVHRLISRGDQVTAFVRRPGSAKSSRVSEVVGDARDAVAVRSALTQVDAVVDVIGAGTLRKNDLESTVMKNVVGAMTQLGVKRLVAMSAGMVVATNPVLDYLFKPTVFRHILAEHRRVEAVVCASDLEWTILRPPRLTSRTGRGYEASTGARYKGSLSIAREDLANFIADELAEPKFVRETVFVSAAR